MTLDRVSRASATAFVTAFVTLLSQVLVHRIVAAKLLTNYAFLIISLTMLGFAVSGVILSRWIELFLEDEARTLGLAASLFALSLLGATWIFYRAPAWPQVAISRPDFVKGFFLSLPLAFLFTLPFMCCGLILGLLLSAPGLRIQKVYFWDLVGSGTGAVAAVPCISLLGAERGVAAGCALLVAMTSLLWVPRGITRSMLLLAGAVVALALWQPGIAFQMRYPPGRTATGVVTPVSDAFEYVAWDAVARIEVSRMAPTGPPAASSVRCLVGEDARFIALFQKALTQNRWAGTMAPAWDGQRESLTGIETTIYGAAYQASRVPAPRVAIIGVGAGMDVLNAFYYGASRVTGIEVNRATVDIVTRVYRDYFRSWAQDPRLHLVVDDGRSFLGANAAAYDVIQISGVDSFAGTAASPHIFSENYLYTAEAFDLYLSRLTENGILNVMRFDTEIPQAIPRLLVTAVGALRRSGVTSPAQHVVTITTDDSGFTAMLVKRTPFTPSELAGLWRWVGASHTFGVSAAPGLKPAEHNILTDFLALADARQERLFVSQYPFDISPSTDDRPFYFRYSFWWHVFPASSMIWRFVPIMEYSLILLLVVAGAATRLLVYVPLRWLPGHARQRPAFATGLFFATLGLGFMAVEIALLQKCGWFLGHPNHALSVVLATLLLGTGVGSMLSPVLVSIVGEVRFLFYALSAVLLAQYFGGFPLLAHGLGLPFPAKVLIVAALVAPAAVLMGCFMPWGLAHLRPVAPSLVPWAWAVNGIFSVLGPILSIGLSMTWGGSALLLSAIPVYLLAGFASASLKPQNGATLPQ